MTKSELVTEFAEEMRLSAQDARAVIDTILEAMSAALARGEHIELRGFCTITVKHYGSYEGRNPKNGEQVTVKPKRLPSFKASRKLLERLNHG